MIGPNTGLRHHRPSHLVLLRSLRGICLRRSRAHGYYTAPRSVRPQSLPRRMEDEPSSSMISGCEGCYSPPPLYLPSAPKCPTQIFACLITDLVQSENAAGQHLAGHSLMNGEKTKSLCVSNSMYRDILLVHQISVFIGEHTYRDLCFRSRFDRPRSHRPSYGDDISDLFEPHIVMYV